MNITAKVKLTTKSPSDGIQDVSLGFSPDYADGRNKEWAAATPSLSLSMVVKASVATSFELGRAYALTFSPEVA